MGGRFIQGGMEGDTGVRAGEPVTRVPQFIKSLLHGAPCPSQARGPGGAGTGLPAGGPFPRQHPAWPRFLSQTPFLTIAPSDRHPLIE